MWAKIKAAFLWVYNWITVIAASLVGIPAILLQIISTLDGIDIAPLLGTDKALKIVTGIAVTKAVLAYIVSKTQARG